MKKLKLLILIAIVLVLGINILAYSFDDESNYSLDNNLINQISSAVPNYTKLDKIPPDLKNAVIAIEDRRFYTHQGVDIIGVGRALLTNAKEGEISEGGSTITQQLAKNLFLSHDRDFKRKIKEMALAIRLENMYKKDQILEMYLNVIYYGAGAYGVENASMTYFGKDVWKLSLAECAMLAGLPQAPSVYNPKKNYVLAKKRQESVLYAMAEIGYPQDKIDKVEKEKVVIVN